MTLEHLRWSNPLRTGRIGFEIFKDEGRLRQFDHVEERSVVPPFIKQHTKLYIAAGISSILSVLNTIKNMLP